MFHTIQSLNNRSESFNLNRVSHVSISESGWRWQTDDKRRTCACPSFQINGLRLCQPIHQLPARAQTTFEPLSHVQFLRVCHNKRVGIMQNHEDSHGLRLLTVNFRLPMLSNQILCNCPTDQPHAACCQDISPKTSNRQSAPTLHVGKSHPPFFP